MTHLPLQFSNIFIRKSLDNTTELCYNIPRKYPRTQKKGTQA